VELPEMPRIAEIWPSGTHSGTPTWSVPSNQKKRVDPRFNGCQCLAILAFVPILNLPKLCFTLMLTGIPPSKIFTARTARWLPKPVGNSSNHMKMCWLLKFKQRGTLASQLLYPKPE
jgi:hypothetical protein